MATTFANSQDRLAYMKVAFAKAQAERAERNRSIRDDDLCLLDALGCVAFGDYEENLDTASVNNWLAAERS